MQQGFRPPIPVATGAKTVRINNQLAARVGETMACSAVIRRGSTGVFIGSPSETIIKPTPEVPVWLENTMLAMAIGGTAIGTLGVGLTYGAGAAVGSLVGGTVGGHLGDQAATAGAAALGYGATGQAIAGGMLGGALGGGSGFKGGAVAQARLRPPSHIPPPVKTPSQQAQQWQGPGNRDYPGIDKYRDITLQPGTRIVAGEPGQGNYYTTQRGFARSGGS